MPSGIVSLKPFVMPVTDITKPVDLTSHPEGTGHLRSRRPVYMDFMPPCNSACPSGENIQAWLSQAQAGNYEEAFQIIMQDNPFPAIMGRVCVKPCETGCNRNHIDQTVNIHAIERFIGDEAIKHHWPIRFQSNPSGKKVLVIGAGPGGLSAAYHLARLGHEVHVFDAGSHPGGLLWTGVPDYRLPKNILDAEISRLMQMGIHFKMNYTVTNVLEEKTVGQFNAVYLSIGAQLIKPEPFNDDGSVIITDAFTFFRDSQSNPSPFMQKKVIVYGGGKLALYLSRMVKRFGSDVSVYFPGDQKMMPAYDYETEDALAEGVHIHLLKKIDRVENNQVVLEELTVDKGKTMGTGRFSFSDADVLIIANRQESNSAFLKNISGVDIKPDGTIGIDAQRMTGKEGIFAGGDMLPAENRSSTIAIGHGKKAAKYIHGYLMGEPYIKPEKHPTAGYRKLHMWYKTEAPQKEQSSLSPHIAVQSFDEVTHGLSEKEARYEAQRCLSCGNCFECDGCFGACPENAIIKLGKGHRYEYNYEACTGCAVCYEQCPCHAIEMIPEPSKTSSHE